MAHFAELDENNVVLRVVSVGNHDTADHDGIERENIGAAYCERLLGGTWKQTSYNGNMRKNYAGIGYSYNAALDAFIPSKPHASWLLNVETAQWYSPSPMPTSDDLTIIYVWDEETLSWVIPAPTY